MGRCGIPGEHDAGGALSVTPEDPANRMARLERELARAVARAESADRRARVLYDGSSDPMLEVDGAGVVRGANGAAVQRLGAAVVGKDLSELFRPGDSETVERMFAGAMETSIDSAHSRSLLTINRQHTAQPAQRH